MQSAPAQSSKAFVFSLALLWIIQKMVFLYLDQASLGWDIGVFGNMAFILAIAAHTLWARYRRVAPSETNMLDDIKSALQRVGLYVMIVGGFIVVYHFVIDPNLIEDRVQQRLADVSNVLDEFPSFEAFVAANDMIEEGATREEFMRRSEESFRSLLNPTFTAGGSLLLLLIWGSFCSLIITALFRGVIFR